MSKQAIRTAREERDVTGRTLESAKELMNAAATMLAEIKELTPAATSTPAAPAAPAAPRCTHCKGSLKCIHCKGAGCNHCFTGNCMHCPSNAAARRSAKSRRKRKSKIRRRQVNHAMCCNDGSCMSCSPNTHHYSRSIYTCSHCRDTGRCNQCTNSNYSNYCTHCKNTNRCNHCVNVRASVRSQFTACIECKDTYQCIVCTGVMGTRCNRCHGNNFCVACMASAMDPASCPPPGADSFVRMYVAEACAIKRARGWRDRHAS